jgi:hypothetical protein
VKSHTRVVFSESEWCSLQLEVLLPLGDILGALPRHLVVAMGVPLSLSRWRARARNSGSVVASKPPAIY